MATVLVVLKTVKYCSHISLSSHANKYNGVIVYTDKVVHSKRSAKEIGGDKLLLHILGLQIFIIK